MRSLVMSIFLYACECWTLTADIQVMEMRGLRKLIGITYRRELRFEGNFSPLWGNQLDFQLSYIVLHWKKVSLVQSVSMLMRDSLGT
ncbi:hypothetical protein NP493_411g00003 [Ridgeia piscesae]|uniref:Secreted protein n=1 Tax=Ridgeia piscesae TaxID=27915 RepID=A0AAD9L161_RIDPI|nr:hypothetical protein NP493_411g00003 [Ridgeia piscesae]